MTNSESSFIVSSMYDLLKPDGINVLELGSGKYQLMRPVALSNLHNIAFRSFTGDLLPFTEIELPKLKAELIMMTNGLKSVTLSGQDTMDLPSVNTYENTKQNIILSIDKAWTYNKDADSQVIYNIEEIVELMNEKLKDYFLFTRLKPTLDHSLNLNPFYKQGYKQIVSERDICPFMYNTTDNSVALLTVNSNDEIIYNTVHDMTYNPNDNMLKLFFDTTSNLGARVIHNTTNNTLSIDIIRYDSVNSRYTLESWISTSSIPAAAPEYCNIAPYHFISGFGTSKGLGVVYAYNDNGHCLIKFDYWNYYQPHVTPTAIDLTLTLEANEHVAAAWATNTIPYVYGFDGAPYGYSSLYIALFKPGDYDESDMVYLIDVSLGSLDFGNSGLTLNVENMMAYADGAVPSSLFVSEGFDQSLKFALANVHKFTSAVASNQIIIANNCFIGCDNSTATSYTYYGNNIFYSDTDDTMYCKCYDGATPYIATVTNSIPIYDLQTRDSGVIKLSSLGHPDVKIKLDNLQNAFAVVLNTNADSSFPIYVYNYLEASTEEYFNQQHKNNAIHIAMINDLNVACSAVDTSNNSVALNPPNGGYLCSNVEDFIKLDAITVIDNAISGIISIPQIEFASDYVLNFNLKIYSDPYYFNIYTSRDFTQQGNPYNLDVNHTDLYYRASNIHVLNTLEYLILLKYNYNLVKLRVYGFPNSDGIVFNMNENSYVSFKNMPTDNTMNNLIVELIGDDNETLPSEILRQLFGKVSLAIDWMQ